MIKIQCKRCYLSFHLISNRNMTLWGLNSTTLFTSQQKGDRHEGALKRSRIPSRISSHQSSSKAPVSDTDHPSLHLQEDYSYFSFDNASFPCLSSARPGLSSARLVSLPRPAALSLCQHPYWRPSLIRSIGVRVNICPSRAPTFCASLRRDRLYFVSRGRRIWSLRRQSVPDLLSGGKTRL